MAHVLWQQRCLEVALRLHHVGVVDETRRTYRHHGRQRDAPRRIATFRHATLRVAPHRYATLEPLGKPGGSRAFSADGPPQAPVAPRRSWEAKYMRADEFAASRRAVLERRYRPTARARSGRPPSSRFRSRTDGKEAAVARGAEGRWSSPRVVPPVYVGASH